MTGFPLNVSLWQAVSPCDYPPISNNQLLSTSPLITGETSSFIGQSPFRERAVHNGLIDMVTGLPLIREVDFELPFGGAVFRHVRTYSEVPMPAITPDYQVEYAAQSSDGAMWDWNGMNWMMSENPLFLIDCSMEGLVESGDPPRCYFIPDAHHSIPFIKSSSTEYPNRYVAPPWFDAVLKAGPNNQQNKPASFELWLHGGAIKYTIEAHYEDMWLARDGVRADERPNWVQGSQGLENIGGFGIPNYGLVKQIEDRYGNKVVITHCEQYQTDCDIAGVEGQECCQNCDQKGQIRFIKLVPAGASSAAWTLIYVHRGFANESVPPDVDTDPAKYWPHLRDQHSLHSIRVFEGDLNESSIPSCQGLTIPAERFCELTSLPRLDEVEPTSLDEGFDNWQIQCKYLYSEFGLIDPNDGIHENPPQLDNCAGFLERYFPTTQPEFPNLPTHAASQCSTANLFKFMTPGWKFTPDNPQAQLFAGRRLVKATTTRRNATTDDEEVRFSLYRDDCVVPSENTILSSYNFRDYLFLKAIYRDSAIQQIVPPEGSGEFDVYRFMSMYEECPVFVREGDEPVSHPIKDLAEVYMYHGRGSTPWPGGYSIHGLLDSVGLDGPRCFEPRVGRGRARFNTAGQAGQEVGDFVYYQAFRYPSEGTAPGDCYANSLPILASTFHFPFRFACQGNIGILQTGLLNDPMWITVIDELDDDPSTPYSVAGPTGIKSRRCVEINPTGFVISDRTMRFDGGPNSQEGFSEKFKYDCKGRILQRRSRGWDTLDDNEKDTQGLIQFWEYPDSEGNCPGEPSAPVWENYCQCPPIEETIDIDNPLLDEDPPAPPRAEGVMKGASGATKFYTRLVERTIPGRPELVTKEVRFPEPVTVLPSGGTFGDSAEVNNIHYEFYFEGENPPDSFWQAPIKFKEAIKPAVRRTLSDPTLRNSVERVLYTETGSPQWTGIGSLANPTAFASGDEFTVGLNLFDGLGRPTYQIADYDPTGLFPAHAPPSGEAWPLPYPSGFQRMPEEPPNSEVQRNFTTAIDYQSEIGGPSRIILPDGKEHRFATVREGTRTYEWAFKNIEFINNVFQTTTPVEITRLDSGKMTWQRKVKLLQGHQDNEPDGRGAEAAAIEPGYSGILSETMPSYDANGRPIGVSQSGGGNSISAAIDYDGFGNINRQEEPDGTITRNVYDELGRLSRVYRGTADENYYWGTALPWPPPCLEDDPPCEPPPPQPIDNMVLVEKRYYGLGATDAGLLTQVRNYRDKPENQYSVPCQPDPCPPSNEDSIGWVTEHQYDWRMRECWVQQNAADAEIGVLSHTLTWMDNLSRPRFVAEYGATVSDNPQFDPRELLTVDSSFNASVILGQSPLPRSLTEYVYNLRGLVEETRRYNVDTGTYLSTLTFYDHLDRQCEVRAPNSPVMRYTYDAKGRRLSSQTWAGSGQNEVEVARSESVYDDDDRVIKSISYERLPGTEHGPVNAGNSVRTFVHNWYDHAGRLVATANYGSYNSTYSPSTSAEPAYNPDIETGIPTSSDAVLVTRYGYDDAGRQDEVTHPDGTVTRTEYDGLGRVTLTIENATGDEALVRRTAYSYDAEGRLETISAVLPNGSQPATQVTKMVYGADVVDSNHAAQSTHNGFIKEVWFPDRVTGQPTDADKFTFTYYSDGSVASRTDQRGVVFRHTYDELGRRVVTTIDDSAWYPAPPPESGLPDFRPRRRISRIAYAYTSDGMLETVTAYTINLLGAEEEVSTNTYTYDALRNLTSEGQSHPSLVTDPPASTAPTVVYDWDFSPMPQPQASPEVTGYNFNRLARILYPEGPPGSTARREVELHYGNNAGDADSTINRITSIDTQLQPGGGILPAAQYAYMGAHRRVGATLGCNVSQTVADSGGCPGLDRFGRLIDLHYQSTTSTIHQYQYGYDRMGNRTHARVTQMPEGQTSHVNDRSYLYSYDALQRLIDSKLGALNGDNSAILSTPVPLETQWGLDNLGNWTGAPGATSPVGLRRSGDFDGNGLADDPPQEWQHVVNASNEIAQLVRHDEPATIDVIHDVAGNLVFDGDYVYQYDGWNRLVQVNLRGTLEISDGSGGSSSAPVGQFTDGIIGDLIARFTYDGLGRLIIKETPVTTGVTALQAKHYYYDGVRRVAEVIDRPAPLEQPGTCCVPVVGCVENILYAVDCDALGGVLLELGQGCESCAWRCCLADGECEDLTETGCAAVSGLFGEPGELCDTSDTGGGEPCIQACCLPGQVCEIMPLAECVTAGGVPRGLGTDCASAPCSSLEQACCKPDGYCAVMLPADCTALGGTVQDPQVTCAEAECVQPEVACCLPNGTCDDLTAAACEAAGGTSRKYPTLCASVTNCPAAQACCLAESPMGQASCQDWVVSHCLMLGGVPQGVGTTCATAFCEFVPVEPGQPGGGGGGGGAGGMSGGSGRGGDDESPMSGTPGGGGGSQQIVERGGGVELPPGETYLDREYVYGPDYVDEFMAQFDRDGLAIYILQDGNYNVVALVAGEGHPDGSGTGGSGGGGSGGAGILPVGTVLEQYTYEPYGALVAVETFDDFGGGPGSFRFAVNRVGHQGLFFERFDGNYNDQTLSAGGGPAFSGGSNGAGALNPVKGHYYNRNRFYSPTLGRFTTRDPNETALPIVTAIVMNAATMDALLSSFNAIMLYRDGMNLYGYQRSNPLIHSDPSGTLLPVLAVVAMPILKATAVGAAIGGLAGGLIEALFVPNGSFWHGASVGAISGAAGGFGMSAFALSASGFLGTIAGKMIAGGIDGGLSAFAGSYYDNRDFSMAFADAAAGAAIGAATGGILHKAGVWACFEEGTLVVMADGTMMPIERLQLTDNVMSRSDSQGLDFSETVPCDANEPWFEVWLRACKAPDSVVDIRLLRPQCWVQSTNAIQGCELDLTSPELGIEGSAEVVAVRTFNGGLPVEVKPGVITGLFKTANANTVEVRIAGIDEPIRATPDHPFWSISRENWIAASKLQPDEALLVRNGEARVKGVVLCDSKNIVYNIEVHIDHNYFVSPLGLWVHNSSATKWGWRGSPPWRNAVRVVERGGTIRGVMGKIPSYDEAVMLLEDAGGTIVRVEGPHSATSVAASIDFPHINFLTSSGKKGHLEILSLP